jgi:hypothetical protein
MPAVRPGRITANARYPRRSPRSSRGASRPPATRARRAAGGGEGANGPTRRLCEEARVVAPQHPDRDGPTLPGRVERLARIGRDHRTGRSIVSQRPQGANTRGGDRADTLVAPRTIGTHERKALDAWAADKGTVAGDVRLPDRLPALATGEAHVRGTAFLKVSQTVRLAATPTFGAAASAPSALAPVDVVALHATLAAVAERAERDGPAGPRLPIASWGEKRQRPRRHNVSSGSSSASRYPRSMVSAARREAVGALADLGARRIDRKRSWPWHRPAPDASPHHRRAKAARRALSQQIICSKSRRARSWPDPFVRVGDGAPVCVRPRTIGTSDRRGPPVALGVDTPGVGRYRAVAAREESVEASAKDAAT